MSISTKPYIGSRDFYPDDMKFRNRLFQILNKTCQKYGYSEYGAPLLEPIGVYRMKSSEEIVNEQLYSFIDRGEREVAIRPEMTPTLARMVGRRVNELQLPLRWFSIANFMRYERPGRGRLREFYQLNVDHLGTDGPFADAEVIMLAIDILREFGANEQHFRLRYNDRRLLDYFLKDQDDEVKRSVARLLDKREKLSEDEYEKLLSETITDRTVMDSIKHYQDLDLEGVAKLESTPELEGVVADLKAIRLSCEDNGYGDYLQFDPGVVRGFDYYTGFIFEIFDTHPENRRSIFGGGRYDRLIGQFTGKNLPAVGFGLGDVTLENFVRSNELLDGESERSGVYITIFSKELADESCKLACELRKSELEVELAMESTKKFGKQLELADRKNRRFIIIMGPDELAAGEVRIKDLKNGEQFNLKRDGLAVEIERILCN